MYSVSPFSQMITDLSLMLKWTTVATLIPFRAKTASRFVCKKNIIKCHLALPIHFFTINGRVWSAGPFRWYLAGNRPIVKTEISLCWMTCRLGASKHRPMKDGNNQ